MAEANRVRTEAGIELPYVDVGDPHGVPVLFLHGFTDSLRSFERLLPLLPRRMRALAVSLRGHGDATRPSSGYAMADFAADVESFIDRLDLDSVVLVGHSMGAAVAQRYAADHASRVRGVVLISARPDLRERPGAAELWTSTISRLTDPIDPAFVRGFSRVGEGAPEDYVEEMVLESLKVPARVWKAVFQAGLN